MGVLSSCLAMAEQLESVESIERVFVAGRDDEDGLPETINEDPAIVVFPMRMEPPLGQMNNYQKHIYLVRVGVFVGMADPVTAHTKAVPILDQLLDHFARNVKLGGRVDQTRLEDWTFGTMQYGDTTYTGYLIDVRVTESHYQEYGV